MLQVDPAPAGSSSSHPDDGKSGATSCRKTSRTNLKRPQASKISTSPASNKAGKSPAKARLSKNQVSKATTNVKPSHLRTV